MKNNKRAIRRHHRERLLRKRRREQYYGIGGLWDGHSNEKERLEYCAFLVNTPTPCSCEMCRSPRRSNFYKGNNKLTIQERKEKCKNIIDMDEITTDKKL